MSEFFLILLIQMLICVKFYGKVVVVYVCEEFSKYQQKLRNLILKIVVFLTRWFRCALQMITLVATGGMR